MSFTLSINSDINKIARCMDNLEKKQLPFAISLTLNKLALLSQETICKRVKQVFNNSRNWWDKRQKTGIKVAFSSKYLLASAVYTKAHFACLQEEGGIKLPYKSSMIAVPTPHIPKKQRHSKALRLEQGNKTVFRIGNSIYKRVSNHNLQRLYSLVPQARVRPILGLKKTAENIALRQFDKLFTRHFNFAMNTAK